MKWAGIWPPTLALFRYHNGATGMQSRQALKILEDEHLIYGQKSVNMIHTMKQSEMNI